MHNESLQNEWRVWNSAQRQLTPTKSYTPAPPSQVGKNVARNIIWKRYHRFTDDIHFYETSLWGPIDSITLHSCTKRYVAPAWTHLQNALYSDLQKKNKVWRLEQWSQLERNVLIFEASIINSWKQLDDCTVRRITMLHVQTCGRNKKSHIEPIEHISLAYGTWHKKITLYTYFSI